MPAEKRPNFVAWFAQFTEHALGALKQAERLLVFFLHPLVLMRMKDGTSVLPTVRGGRDRPFTRHAVGF